MAKTFNADRITKPGAHATGVQNLYLLIASNGRNARSWSFRFYRHGKTHVLGLGPLHTITFERASVEAAKIRLMLLEGKDPKIERARAITAPTFDKCSEELIEAKRPEWASLKHAQQWTNTLATYASPVIGALPVDGVATEHILRILQPIWATKTETASRVRQRIESVLDYAKSKHYRTGDNPAAWAGHLEHLLAAPGRIRTVRHHPSLAWQQMPAFLAALREHRGQGAKAIELLIMTACRSGEVRGARWPEFNFDALQWTIPAERMKAGVAHVVPLAPAVVELLEALPRHEGTDLVFASTKRTPLSDMALSEVVRGMNDPEVKWKDAAGLPVVVHGFRSSFRVWAAEATTFPREVAEHALAHRLPDAVEAAYQRSTLPAQRARMMADWAAWVTT